ncbi:MAG: pyridoxamine 5'-phosphate oxidase family protein [Clostridia bacterium]|nr:pyridoxamine 5'-phosphate oxidase family protein [Clostridia bacterium]
MFRELTRKNKQLSNDDCINILIKEKRGVLSVNGDEGYPYGMPMNHFYNEADGCIYFHCGKNGHRLDSLKANNKVSFCVYDEGCKNDGEWALNIKSVIVFGTTEIIDDIAVIIDISEKLSRKFTDDTEYIETEIRNYAKNTLLIRLTPEHICGKAIKES